MFMHAWSADWASKSRIETNQFGDLNVEWLFKMMMQHDLQHLHNASDLILFGL